MKSSLQGIQSVSNFIFLDSACALNIFKAHNGTIPENQLKGRLSVKNSLRQAYSQVLLEAQIEIPGG